MNRDEKAAAIQGLAEDISASDAVFAIDYRGISVAQAAELRRKLRDNGASFRVSKNRLAKMAASQAEREELHDFLVGPTALTFVRGDAAAVAKAVTDFSKQNEVLSFKGGLLGASIIDEAEFSSIARLPTRDALNGQLAGVIASPLTGLVRGLGSLVSGLAVALQQVADQGLVGGAEPVTQEPATEEPAAEEQATEDVDATAEEADEAAPDPGAAEAEEQDAGGDDTEASDDSNQKQE